MFLLVLSALRARRSQTIALFALTVLAGLGASAAPWYAGWARDAVTRANIAAAPAEQRIVAAAGAVRLGSGGPDPLVTLRQRVGQQLDIPGSDVVVGARLYATMSPAGAPRTPSAGEGSQASGLYLTYRDRVCEQLTIEGACPGAAGDVVIGKATAAALGLAVGDQVRFEGFRLPAPAVLRISGVYEVADLLSPYWAGTDLLTGGSAGAAVDDPAFVSADTLFAARPDGLDTDFHLVLPEAAFLNAGQDAGLASTLARATAALRQANLEVRTDAVTLIDQIRRDRRLVALGILVATVQLVLLCWVGLFLAVRHTSDDRQGDIGLLKLRGAPAWRTWALAAQQSALPMVAGALVGWVLGYLAASALAGTPAKGGALGLSLLAVALACLGALVAAVVAEWRSLGAPVVTLLRRVPERHRGWRADVVELVVVLLAVVGVYQGHAEISSDGEPSVLALLAPGLVGLAVALLVARAMPAVAARLGLNALRRGQPGAALAALHLARRPGTHRIFAVLAVAVSVFITVVLFWHAAGVAWSERAVQELGAARVLTVRAPNSTQLLAAVREVDPDGRVAMAVARTQGVRTEDR
ncbi:MAG TPA: FtsX-like permease family protein, partial [Actinomycetota bacterium]|nr:FtsX-like permease family protein [Actinomycetota bacterium]